MFEVGVVFFYLAVFLFGKSFVSAGAVVISALSLGI